MAVFKPKKKRNTAMADRSELTEHVPTGFLHIRDKWNLLQERRTPNPVNILLMLLYIWQVTFQLFKQNPSTTKLTSLAIHLVREWNKSRKLKKKAELSKMYSWNMQPYKHSQVTCIEYSNHTFYPKH